MRRAARLAALTAAFALAACSAPAPQSAGERRHEQTARDHERAAGALAGNDYGEALQQYQSALNRSRAVEDQDAVAVNLLNFAAVLHRAGEYAAARAKLMELLSREPPFGAAYAGRAEARLALIDLQTNRISEAASHAERAAQLCPPAGCPWQLALANVQAGIALRNSDLAGAEARARANRAAAALAKDLREEANAWRLLGEIASAGARGAEAREAFLAALDLDKRAEEPEHIALDLLALARLELALGERKAARDYAGRAAQVAESARLAAPLAAARGLLRAAQ